LRASFNDETLPNFIKRKHPRMGEKKSHGSKFRQANSLTEADMEERDPLRTEPFTSHMKHIN
jgi:hypothetical protein